MGSSQDAIPVGSKSVTVTLTPTLDTSAYATGDNLVAAVLQFVGAVGNNLTGFIEKMVVVDKDVQSQPLELWLFDSSVTPAAANAAHSISDADALKCIGVIGSGSYFASALNSVSVATGVGLPIKTVGTILYGILVTRGAPTYTAAGLQITLQISID